MIVAPGFVSRLRRWFTEPVEPTVRCRCPLAVGRVHVGPVSALMGDGWLGSCTRCGRVQRLGSFAAVVDWAAAHDRTHR